MNFRMAAIITPHNMVYKYFPWLKLLLKMQIVLIFQFRSILKPGMFKTLTALRFHNETINIATSAYSLKEV